MCSPCDLLTIVMATTIMCKEPHYLHNGSYVGPEEPWSGSLYNYTCDHGFIPSGAHSENLQIECLESGEFSLSEDQLAFCEQGCPSPPDIKYGGYNGVLTSIYAYGENVTYFCDEGYYNYPENNSLSQCGSESWTPAPHCLAECPEPSSVPYAVMNTSNVMIDGLYLSGTQVTYTCDLDHALKVDVADTLTCDGDGNWTAEFPTCYPICEVAPEITNGNKHMVHNTSLENGTVTEMIVQYSCNVNYTMVGNDTLQCHPGPRWEPSSPPDCLDECPAPASLSNGNVTITYEVIEDEMLTGTLIEYQCDANYIFNLDDNTLSCGYDGLWNSTEEPQCLRECPALSASEAMTVTLSNEVINNEIVEGTTYDITCDSNYIISDYRLASPQCTSDGSYTNELPTCERDCGVGNDLYMATKTVHSSANITYDGGERVVEHNITYSCADGYELVPEENHTLVCTTSGSFDKSYPQCVADCEAPINVTNGNYRTMSETVPGKYLAGTTVIYECDDPYTFVMDSTVFYCTSAGTYSYTQTPQCLMECPALVETDGMTLTKVNDVMPGKDVSGTIYNITCGEHYIISDYSFNQVVCDSDGEWDTGAFGFMPTCVRDCGEEVVIQNGTTESRAASIVTTGPGESRTLPQALRFTCDDGFVMAPETSENVGCTTYGEFDPEIPECLIDCGHERFLTDGRSEITTAVYNLRHVEGVVVTYTCDEGFIWAPQENRTVTCLPSGDWTKMPGTCHPDCGVSPDLVTGKKNVTGSIRVNETFDLEQEVTYSCEEPLTLLPPHVWTCQDNGSFDNTIQPICIMECPAPTNISHGRAKFNPHVKYHGYGTQLPGTIFEYECEEFYVLTGEPLSYHCSEDGTWNITEVPRCELEWSETRQCNASYSFHVTNVTGNFNEIRQVCLDMGGDLIHENLGFEPGLEDKYHSNISALTYFTRRDIPHIYIGATDDANEGDYRFVDGTPYNHWDSSVTQLYGWASGEPNDLGRREDCVEVTVKNELNDVECRVIRRGLCEFKNIICVDL